MLLPYMEQGPLYNSFNFANTGNAANPGNGPEHHGHGDRDQRFQCPSDTDRLTGTGPSTA